MPEPTFLLSTRRWLTPPLRDALRSLGEADALSERGEHAEARRLYVAARATARGAGLGHGMLSWRLAVLSDYLGEMEDAMAYAIEALEQEPLSVPFRRSFDVIARRIRDALTSPARDPADPSTPRLYALLVREGEADTNTHLAMAHHLATVGDDRGALRILEALCVLAPACAEVWRGRAALARRAGDAETAAACELEAAACEGMAGPAFPVPGRAEG